MISSGIGSKRMDGGGRVEGGVRGRKRGGREGREELRAGRGGKDLLA